MKAPSPWGRLLSETSRKSIQDRCAPVIRQHAGRCHLAPGPGQPDTAWLRHPGDVRGPSPRNRLGSLLTMDAMGGRMIHTCRRWRRKLLPVRPGQGLLKGLRTPDADPQSPGLQIRVGQLTGHEIVAMNAGEMKVMLADQTILAIRAIFDEDGRQVGDWDDATTMLVVDHRTKPPTLVSIPIADIEFSPEC